MLAEELLQEHLRVPVDRERDIAPDTGLERSPSGVGAQRGGDVVPQRLRQASDEVSGLHA